MVHDGKPYQNGWFAGTTIFRNIHVINDDSRSPEGKLPVHNHPPPSSLHGVEKHVESVFQRWKGALWIAAKNLADIDL